MARAVRQYRLVAAGALLVLLAGACAGPSGWVLEDPAGDDHGPGEYRYPQHPDLGPGQLDLRRVRLERQGRYWRVEVDFSAALVPVEVFVSRDERRRAFLPVVDLYFRLPGKGPARAEALPGRRVEIAGGWHKAVVLSPVPDLLAEALSRSGDLGARVLVPGHVQVSGRRLRARVPVEFLGRARPQALAVLVGGARFWLSFRLADRLRGQLRPEGLLMPVASQPAPCRLDDAGGPGCHFSGCRPCGGHPQVMDILAPAGLQEHVLGEYRRGRIPVVPALVLSGGGQGE